jgi:hypothetical protein
MPGGHGVSVSRSVGRVKGAWYPEPVVDHPFQLPLIVDLGLGLYAVYGAQKAMLAGLPLLAAALIDRGLVRGRAARERAD